MKKTILLLIFTSMFSLILTADDQQKPEAQFKKQLDEIKLLLQQIEGTYIQPLNYYERRTAIQKMDKIMDKLIALENDFKPQTQTEEEEPVVVPIPHLDEAAFNKLLQTLNDSHDDSEKIILIQHAYNQKYMNCEQLRHLISKITFNSEQITLFKYAYQKVLDKQNIYDVITVFPHYFDRKDLREWVTTQ